MQKSTRWLIGVLAVMAAACGVGLFFTGAPRRSVAPAPAILADNGVEVDERPLDSARQLGRLAATPDEQKIAQDAVRAADREVDLAFASALRSTNRQERVETPETRALNAKIVSAQAAVTADQQRVATLTAEAKTAKTERQADLQQQLDLLQAEINLRQDELADAQQDLERAGGDPHAKIQQMLEAHEASEHSGQGTRIDDTALAATGPTDSLSSKIARWSALRAKLGQLREAQQEAVASASVLTGKHNALEAATQAAKPAGPVVALPAGGATGAGAGGPATPPTVAALRRMSDDEKTLADFDKRIDAFHGLRDAYTRWVALANDQVRQAAHAVVLSVFWIVFTLALVYFAIALLDHVILQLSLERKRESTLRAMVRLSLQVVGVLVVLVILFGTPSQFSTVLGLAGAGLTVVLKDFIVSFLGWFALMGRNGIHLGDAVEINGVRGEVIEIGLLRTVLLETGNWTDAGHPTGRKVAFLNNYAVEGYYFNFTTTGQWLWDQLQLAVPEGGDLRLLLEGVRRVVAETVGPDAEAAQKELEKVSSRYHVHPLPVEPSVEVRPVVGGLQMVIHFLTRATERSALRTRLYREVVELYHGSGVPAPELEAPK